MKFVRITVDPNVCLGKPCIRGLRFPVSRLLGLLASGETKESILKAYPYIEARDIEEAFATLPIWQKRKRWNFRDEVSR